MSGLAGSVTAVDVVTGIAAAFVVETIVSVAVLGWLLRKPDPALDHAGDDWESFEQEFAAYVAAGEGPQRGFPARP